MKSYGLVCIAGLLSLYISCTDKGDSHNKSNALLTTESIDTITVSYFKEIAGQQKLVKSNDSQMLSIIDSLFSRDEIKQGFYFLVFTKSMTGSDGFYSEALSRAAFEYLTTRTDRFTQNISSIHELNDIDFNNWADYVFREIQIKNEGNELEMVNEIETLLIEKIRSENRNNEKVIEILFERIRSRAHNKNYIQWRGDE